MCPDPPAFVEASGLEDRYVVGLVHTPEGAPTFARVFGGEWDRSPCLGLAGRGSPR